MQIYTHFALGLVASQMFQDPFSQTVVIFSSCLPDSLSVAASIKDKLLGKTPFENIDEIGKGFILVSNVLHSLVVWLPSILYPPLFIGIYSHLIPDVLSHNGEKFRRVTATFVWPLPFSLRECGLYESRSDPMSLWSPVDMIIFAIASALTAVLFFMK